MSIKKNVSEPTDLKFKTQRRKFKKKGKECVTIDIIGDRGSTVVKVL